MEEKAEYWFPKFWKSEFVSRIVEIVSALLRDRTLADGLVTEGFKRAGSMLCAFRDQGDDL
jgi:hypothetical protein